ncbi:MAG: hypothetical protein WBA97_35610 [Actinophytocola sp.]|uniref:hypothetical protein n=1 Tax=Actinophytocola sp. TaxID=1872138 RepID=UPI003C727615
MDEPQRRLSAGLASLRRGLGRYRILLAVLVLLLLSLLYVLVFDKSVPQLIEAALPNAVAALFVFLALYALYQFIGIAPTDEVARLLDRHQEQLADHLKVELQGIQREVSQLSIPRPRGILDFFPHWSEMTGQDWERILSDATHVDIVMNWCDSWLEANARLFRELLEEDTTVSLYLPHPGFDNNNAHRDRIHRLATTYDVPRHVVRFRIAESAAKFVDLGADPDRLTVRLVDGLTFAAVRVNEYRLLVSHYDQFRVGHPKAYALLVDLHESSELFGYWTEQFDYFNNIAPTPVERLIELRKTLNTSKIRHGSTGDH